MIWPLLFTVLFFYLAYTWTPKHNDEIPLTMAIGCILFPIAAFLSMFVWFIWALLT